jgi:hypothetical protein
MKEKLEELINAEKSSEMFTQMPNPFYMEITNVLLNWYVSGQYPLQWVAFLIDFFAHTSLVKCPAGYSKSGRSENTDQRYLGFAHCQTEKQHE